MSSGITSLDGDADKYAAIVKAVYQSALKEQDTDAKAIEKLSPTKPSEPVSKMSEEELNKYMIFALKKVTGVLAAAVTGDITSTHTDAVIDFLVSAAGIKLPKDQPTVVIEMLGDIKERLNQVLEGQRAGEEHTTRTMQIQKINDLLVTTNTIWTTLRHAIEFRDPQRVFEQIEAIDTNQVKIKLNAMRMSLRDPDVSGNDGLARSVQQLYKTRLEDTQKSFNFDARTYLEYVHQWNNLVSSVDRMSTALLVLFEQCREVEVKVRQSWQQLYKNESQSFLDIIGTMFLGDIGLWPSTKALAEAASVDYGKQFPQVFELHTGSRHSMFVKDITILLFGAEQAYTVYGFKEDEKDSSTPVNRAFAFESQDRVWHIKANREIQNSSDCLFFGRWEKLRNNDDDDYPLVARSGDEATFKIIPLEHADECRVKLVWLKKDRTDNRKILEPITMIRSNLSYPVFGHPQGPDSSGLREFIGSKSGQKFHCNVGNRTSDLVMVLDDAYAAGTYHYRNTVWLPGDNYHVGAWSNNNVGACFRFAIYKLKDSSSDKEVLRSRVQELFGQLPLTGRLGLRADGAELIKYIWLRPEVPKFGKNLISVAEFRSDDENKDIIDWKTPSGLSGWLDNFTTTTDATKWFEWSLFKAEVRIGGGDFPGSFCNIHTK